MTKAECEAPTHFRGMNITKCLTMERWGQVRVSTRPSQTSPGQMGPGAILRPREAC